jgi:hypothetical protein
MLGIIPKPEIPECILKLLHPILKPREEMGEPPHLHEMIFSNAKNMPRHFHLE